MNYTGWRGSDRYDLTTKTNYKFELLPIRDAVESEWAWAAGVYEGEGSVHNNSRNVSRHALQVRISQKDIHILRQLKQFCGGSIMPTSEGQSALAMSGHNARRFIRRTWKWLSPRRQTQITGICPIEEC